ncbi:hypothetical protein, partial [Enterococcus sp. AZ102]|uniref:hypothetical protein n=1 Tax=Enterococcus sp. AZ102 TaxID=2774865 RepID=UPI003F683D32
QTLFLATLERRTSKFVLLFSSKKDKFISAARSSLRYDPLFSFFFLFQKPNKKTVTTMIKEQKGRNIANASFF